MLSNGERAEATIDLGVHVFSAGPAMTANQERPLDQRELADFQQHLQHLRQWLQASISDLECKSLRASAVQRFVSYVDPADSGGHISETAAEERTLADKRLLLNEILGAFERIREKTYGLCVHDQSQIPRSLLEEVPWARFCATCASRHQ